MWEFLMFCGVVWGVVLLCTIVFMLFLFSIGGLIGSLFPYNGEGE